MYLGSDIFNRAKRITDDQLREMGRVIVNWSVLENYVSYATVAILHVSVAQGLAIVTPVRNFRQRLAMMLQSFKETFPDRPKPALELVGLCNRILDHHSFRNRVAHGVWGVDDEGAEQLLQAVQLNLKEKAENDWTIHRLTDTEMRAQADAMLVTARDLGKFVGRERPTPPASRQKLRGLQGANPQADAGGTPDKARPRSPSRE